MPKIQQRNEIAGRIGKDFCFRTLRFWRSFAVRIGEKEKRKSELRKTKRAFESGKHPFERSLSYSLYIIYRMRVLFYDYLL